MATSPNKLPTQDASMQQREDAAEITAKQRRDWDRTSRAYAEGWIARGNSEPVSHQVVDVVLAHVNPNAGGKTCILDLASSSGMPAVPLAQSLPNAQIVATDLAPSAVSFIRQHAETKGVRNVSAQAADAQDLTDFEDTTFAAVTCSYGLMFMPEHQRALAEAYRVLQSGGLFVATVFASLDNYQFGWMFSQVVARVAGNQARPPPLCTPWRFGKPGQLTEDLKTAGFSSVQCTAFNHPMTWKLQDLYAFQIGPHGQSRPIFDKLKAAGWNDVYKEAEQVTIDILNEKGWLQGDFAVFEHNTAFMYTAIKPREQAAGASQQARLSELLQ